MGRTYCECGMVGTHDCVYDENERLEQTIAVLREEVERLKRDCELGEKAIEDLLKDVDRRSELLREASLALRWFTPRAQRAKADCINAELGEGECDG